MLFKSSLGRVLLYFMVGSPLVVGGGRRAAFREGTMKRPLDALDFVGVAGMAATAGWFQGEAGLWACVGVFVGGFIWLEAREGRHLLASLRILRRVE